jgi:D-glycero-D-manno-heptose 1,7-bisphosphate phosphatase
MEGGKAKAIFLDRDGVLNQEIGEYVYSLAQLIIPTDVAQGLHALRAAGYLLIVVTNQGGIDRGLYTKNEVALVNAEIERQVGLTFDAIYYSPHANDVSRSLLSKPGSIMLEKGIARFNLDTAKCFLVGDAERDLAAAYAVGVRPILLPTLKEQSSQLAVSVVTNFTKAVKYILNL